jgi:hypothetical protein
MPLLSDSDSHQESLLPPFNQLVDRLLLAGWTTNHAPPHDQPPRARKGRIAIPSLAHGVFL